MGPEFQKPLFIFQVQNVLGLATPMEKTGSGTSWQTCQQQDPTVPQYPFPGVFGLLEDMMEGRY